MCVDKQKGSGTASSSFYVTFAEDALWAAASLAGIDETTHRGRTAAVCWSWLRCPAAELRVTQVGRGHRGLLWGREVFEYCNKSVLA